MRSSDAKGLVLAIVLALPSLAAAQLTGTTKFTAGVDQPLQDGRWSAHRGGISGVIQAFSLRAAGPLTGVSYACRRAGEALGPSMTTGLCGSNGNNGVKPVTQFKVAPAAGALVDVFYQCEIEGGGVVGPYSNGTALCGDGVHSLKSIQVWTMARPAGPLPLSGTARVASWSNAGVAPVGSSNMTPDGMIGLHNSALGLQGVTLTAAATIAPSVSLKYTCYIDGQAVSPPPGTACAAPSGGFLDGIQISAVTPAGAPSTAFDVYYGCDAFGLGSTDVVSNGAVCGRQQAGNPLVELQVWLRPKLAAPIVGCPAGRAHCTANPADNCETDITVAGNCGGCGITCADNSTSAHRCVPASGDGICVNFDPTAAATRCGGTSGTDKDGDGLSDSSETLGYIDLDCSGSLDYSVDTPLPAADPARPNVYVKYDYLYVDPSHTHAPTAGAMPLVQRVFLDAGIILGFYPTSDSITEKGNAEVVSLYPANPPAPASCVGDHAESLYTLKAAHFPANLAPAYHYAVFSHYNTCDSDDHCRACPLPTPPKFGAQNFGTTGIAEVGGNDLIVSLGSLMDGGTNPVPSMIVAGTFMHELGHNLGLRHGGGGNVPDADFTLKPNYISVMNYAYQFGIGATASPGPYPCDINDPSLAYRIDYSSFLAGSLDEGVAGAAPCHGPTPPAPPPPGMDRARGIWPIGPSNPHPTDVATFLDANGLRYCPSNGSPINWDSSPTSPATGLAFADVNADSWCSSLHGYQDWTSLHLKPSDNPANWADGVSLSCLTGDQAKKLKLIRPAREVQIVVAPNVATPSVAAMKRWLPPSPAKLKSGARALVPWSLVRADKNIPVQVAILGSKEVPVAQIDVPTLRFGGASPDKEKKPVTMDVNGDHLPDLVVPFTMSALVVSAASHDIALTGASVGAKGGPRVQLAAGHALRVVSSLGPQLDLKWNQHHHIIVEPEHGKKKRVTLADCLAGATDVDGEPLKPNQAGRILKVTTNEKDAEGVKIVNPSTVELPREADADGHGRVYTLHFEIADKAKNVTAGTCRVAVPLAGGGQVVDGPPLGCVGQCADGMPTKK